MNFSSTKANLKPATYYNRLQYKTLRQMTDAPATGCCLVDYRLSSTAALRIETQPEILLHNRVYNRADGKVFLYTKKDQELCAIQTCGGVNIEQRMMAETVCVFSPEEIPDNIEPEIIELAADYPAPLLPFEINILKALVGSEATDLSSKRVRWTIDFSSCPFFIYQIFHSLRHYPEKVPGSGNFNLKRLLDLGSGLGTVSFVASQFMPESSIHGIEIDDNLLGWSYKLKRFLEKKSGYDLANVRFVLDDVRTLSITSIEEFDAIIGWFPIAHNISNDFLFDIFKQLKPGALLLMLFKGGNLPENEAASQQEFKPIPTNLPVNIFQRI